MSAVVAVSAPAFAREDGSADEVSFADRLPASVPATDIVVVASGQESRLADVAQPVSVIGAEEIGRVQGEDVTRVLERLPGVTWTRNGGIGSFTGVRVRGANAEQVLVLVDGVKMADVSSPGGGFDFGNLAAGEIGQVELLRGPASTIWGSEALGGVIAVTTRQVEGLEASAQYGADDTVDLQARAGHAGEILSASLDAGFFDSDGYSAARNGSEADGFRQWRVGGKARAELGGGFALLANARYAEGRLEIDGFPPPDYVFADTAEYQENRQLSGRAAIDYASNALDLTAAFSLADLKRDSFNPEQGSDPAYRYKGHDESAELRGTWRVAGPYVLRFGGEREWRRFSSTYDARKTATESGAYAQAGFEGSRAVAHAGLRYEDHDGFGEAWTFAADGAWRIGGGWRLRASYGEGFKAPTLYQLHSDYGNALLRPERSHAFDAGIEKGDRNAPLHLALSAFRRDSEDLIDFVSCFGESDGICTDRPYGTYDNVARARAQGFEAEAAVMPVPALRLQGVYSYVEAVNRTAGDANEGRELARRPRHALTLSADWAAPFAGVSLGADLRVVSSSYDDAANLVKLDGYAVLTLRGSVALSEGVDLFGRIENVTDSDYQAAAGYGTQGRAAFAGARARF